MLTQNLAIRKRFDKLCRTSQDGRTPPLVVPRAEMEEYIYYLFSRQATHGDAEPLDYSAQITFFGAPTFVDYGTPWHWRDFKSFIYGVLYGAGPFYSMKNGETGYSAALSMPGVEPKHLVYRWRREVPWDPEGD